MIFQKNLFLFSLGQIDNIFSLSRWKKSAQLLWAGMSFLLDANDKRECHCDTVASIYWTSSSLPTLLVVNEEVVVAEHHIVFHATFLLIIFAHHVENCISNCNWTLLTLSSKIVISSKSTSQLSDHYQRWSCRHNEMPGLRTQQMLLTLPALHSTKLHSALL